MNLTSVQLDRACGVVLGTAVGDALGAGYEFGSAPLGPEGPQMIGGGLGDFAPGQWTDDTTMAWCILDAAAKGFDLRNEDGLTEVALRFREWYDSGPADIGNQTRYVLDEVGPSPTGQSMTATSFDLHARTGHTAGNGSLMRTAPVALRYLDDYRGLIEAARKVGALTHYDQRAQEACVIWSLAIRHAVLKGELNLWSQLEWLDIENREYWTYRLEEAEMASPSRFRPNGWVVSALQAAWSAIVHSPNDGGGGHVVAALGTAIGIGDDTDTVAAIAGGLLGARWGASAIPVEWVEILHGYPGITAGDLAELARLTVSLTSSAEED